MLFNAFYSKGYRLTVNGKSCALAPVPVGKVMQQLAFTRTASRAGAIFTDDFLENLPATAPEPRNPPKMENLKIDFSKRIKIHHTLISIKLIYY